MRFSKCAFLDELRNFALFLKVQALINFNFIGPPESMEMLSVNGGSVNGQDFSTEETDEDFDEDIPAHRRMTVTRVADHAELADSVLSAPSAPTINLTPMSPKFGHHYHPHQTINDVIEASVKMEQAH